MSSELLNRAEKLAERIRQESAEGRLKLRSEYARLMSDLRSEGVTVPRRLHQLDVDLSEEEAENQFDNMPV